MPYRLSYGDLIPLDFTQKLDNRTNHSDKPQYREPLQGPHSDLVLEQGSHLETQPHPLFCSQEQLSESWEYIWKPWVINRSKDGVATGYICYPDFVVARRHAASCYRSSLVFQFPNRICFLCSRGLQIYLARALRG